MIGRVLLVTAVSLGMAACVAPGPAPSADPPVAAQLGRIYFYRTSFSIGSENGLLGSPGRPQVSLDGKPVAEASAGSVFFCDVAPGPHQVMVRASRDYSLAITVASGQTAYVKLDWGIGGLSGQGHVLEVGASTARPEIEGRARAAAACPPVTGG